MTNSETLSMLADSLEDVLGLVCEEPQACGQAAQLKDPTGTFDVVGGWVAVPKGVGPIPDLDSLFTAAIRAGRRVSNG